MEEKVYGYDESFNKVEVHQKDYTDQLAQDNLLVNSNWKEGIINQKAQPSYIGGSTKVLSIDGWFCINNVSQLDVHEDYINIYNRDPSSLSYVGQSNRQRTEEYLTVAVYVRTLNGTLEARLGYYSNSTFKEKKVTLKEGLNVFTTDEITDEFSQLNFVLNPNSNAYLEYAKVEKGKHFTGMSAWYYPIEFLKCVYRYINFYGQSIKRVAFVGQSMAYITFELPTTMVENISVVIRENTNMLWQNDNTQSPISTKITNAEIQSKQGNAITVVLYGNFGNTNWRVAYCSSVGVEFDGYQY